MAKYVGTETTLTDAVERLLTDSRIADVELEGDDGVRLPGCRGLLAARSEVFERMLMGQFSESIENVVKIGYPGQVLKKLVRYCYSDQVDLTMTASVDDGEENSLKKEYIHQLLLLADAANYFELSQLRHIVILKAKELLLQHPHASFCYLEEAKCVGCTEVLNEALVTIQSHLPRLLAVNADSIRALSPLSLAEVLADSHCPCEERLLYQLLQVWIDDSPERCKIAKAELAQKLRLDLIPASVLEQQVTLDGLVDQGDIYLAYKEQAKLAEKRMELLYSRSSRRWKSSKSSVFRYESEKDTVDFLQSERLSSGIYEWTIVVENLTENMFLGVEGGKHDFWLGYNGVRWRDKFHNGQGGITFRTKSVVTMTLDLTRGGTLEAKVDDSETETLFTKMLTADDKDFVPAICVKKQGSVRFVGLRRLS